ncbi:signal peptidase II [Tengunoibacter tsumagoiensis]|uniref:Lipoprotein signal peptidase n=1 Tax=Tengunoibacter tsumagoiensis TaxID=2014871 RepID=A0A402A1L5_9CHLR|nr:signal peptidase II [Tengunoibacter tsumagoiensis]GCE12939.1 lipoprotein signal peptidase [Tengunoibacter tsumagoiensis]
MLAKRARLYDALALLTVIVVIALDQWTKTLVVNTIPLYSEAPFPILGRYLVFEHILNNGAAFSMFQGNLFLIVFILLAIGVVAYLYGRILNTGPLLYKVVFGLIIGGAVGNIVDRLFRGGAVVDFISFRIPEMNFYFAIFNVADAFISIGVALLFMLVLFGGGLQQKSASTKDESIQPISTASAHTSGPLQSTEQDAKS